jgi:hypothetical protein
MRRRRHLAWWLRAKTMRLVRRHYMVGFSIVALVVAGAAAVGYFDVTDDTRVLAERRQPAIPTPIPYVTPAVVIPTDPLIVTFVIVDSEDHLAVMDSFENGLIWREVLRHGTFETLLVASPEDEAQAQKIIAATRERGRSEGFQVVVQDMRD